MKRFLFFGFLLFPFWGMGQVVDTAKVRREVDSLVNVCRALIGEIKYKESLVIIEWAEQVALNGFGKESEEYAKCVSYHGRVFYLWGKYSESELMYLKAKDIREKVLGKKHPDYASSLYNLGNLYLDMGNYEKAESLYLEVKAIREKVLGNEHPDYAQSVESLANLYRDKGNYEKAEPLYHEVNTVREKIFGKEHLAYAQGLDNLAILYAKMGNYEKCIPLFFEAKTMRKKVLGAEHPDYAKSLTNLAVCYNKTGKYEKAEPLYLEAHAIWEKTLGKEHPYYALILNNLANLYWVLGSYEKAEPLSLEALAIREKALGKEHPDFAWSLTNLANLYEAMGKYEKAEPLHLEALAIQEKVLGKEHPDYARSLDNLANLYRSMGNYEKAEQLFLESLAIREKALNKEHPHYAESLGNLAVLYLTMGNYEKAESLSLEALAILEKALGKEHPDYAAGLTNLANLYEAMSKYEKAEPLSLEALAIQEKVLGKEHPDYARSLNNLANLYEAMGKYEKTEPLFLEALAIFEKALSKEHPAYAASLTNLGLLYETMGKYEKAESFCLEAKAIQEQALGKEHPDYARSLGNLATINWLNQKSNKAGQFFSTYSAIERALLLKASRHLSERELASYIQKFADWENRIYSFNQIQAGDISVCYDNILFHKGFLLNAVSHLNKLALSDSVTAEKYYRFKSYNHRLAAEYAKPIVERKNLPELEEKANTLEKELTRTVAGFGEALRQVNWREVQQQLQLDEAAIEFVHYAYLKPSPTDSTLYAALILLPTDTAPHFIPLCEQRQLDALIPERIGPMHIYLQNLYTYSRSDSSASLYQLLWAPIDTLLHEHGIRTVYYSPSGLLHRLNLAAITYDKSDQTLADRYRLIPMGSTRSLAVDARAGQSVTGHSELRIPVSAIIYGGVRYDMDSVAIARANIALDAPAQDTTGGWFRYAERAGERADNWEYLPGTEKEARYLDNLLKNRGIHSTLRLGYAATEESFKQIGKNAPSPGLLHIGTHGFFFPDPKDTIRRRASFGNDAPAFKISEHPLIRSGLKLAGSRYAWDHRRPMHGMEDGILTAHEVSQMNLSNTELVVLSACETGLGDIRGNEGVYGLQRALRIAGAKNVLMSLWKVQDDVTEQLLTRFYENWLERKMPLRESFEEAQHWMRNQELYQNPYFWAGFVLIGEK